MKRILMIPILLLLASPLAVASTAAAPIPVQATLALSSEEAPILGIGTPKYNKRKLTRQNTVGKTNQRNKRNLKKWNLAVVLIGKEASNG